jgi:NAD(P)-dependent dehydrogenase (short-subunit alcohol dehydrogenase family)
MQRLADKIAIVTGAAQGIGASFAKGLAAEGAKVVIADVGDGTETAESIVRANGTATYIRTDVSKASDVKTLVDEVMRRYGTIDILVNNAAIFAKLGNKKFQDISSEEFDAVMSVNVRGPFECAKAVAPIMMEKGAGKIVNIASGTVFKGVPMLLHYVASKGAVVAMTRSLARELGDAGIRVNTLAPGLTASENTRNNPAWQGAATANNIASRAIKREATPEDLSGTLVYLASADSDFVTGQVLVVDGGSVMH